ncbi:MATE family efflux transporter [Lacrimispora saccharolytica]|uniref:Multi antimicrobial extrusion protein MatE n=1 Tax=Lacrimispora saccharolytica (strain ATCC 35040 / DSM 2544 / NRCC 2533 / WM1) TaxID=610130 RepID=D9R7N4_LACSW|nr:MATE family efflux transporter [Lacrimispora saccharolytica]ADL03763.1 multi antimicrobial extrusion protein MatE [[Clostridium] saccharolyticum WM1]QRV18107.1 polysaccharide biosynthesis C-terminal domain-containing protein [Lacrimispora saccharolytica]
MNLESIQNNKIKTILQFSIPSIIAMMLTSLITVTDGFFIGNYVGKEGLAAVNLGLPIVYLYLAVGLMVSVGGVAIAGMALGSKDIKKCNSVFNQTMCTAMAATILLSVIVWLCLDTMLHILNADVQVAGFFTDYYGIMLLELPIMVINASFGMFIRGEGKPQYFMLVNILNVLLNMLLDYLFVRWFGLGVKGIAAASLLAAVVTLLCILYFFTSKSSVYKFGRFTFSGDVLGSTLLNGSSEFVGEMSMSISMFAYNYVILKNIGVDGVTAFTIVGYICYIFSMVIIGFGQGASPLISFTYGSKEHFLAVNLRRITNFMVLTAGAVVLLLVLVGSGWYSSLFVKSVVVEQMVHSGVIIYAVSFLFSGINTISSFYFTSIGKAKESAIISSARGLVILLICIFTLPPLFGMTGVWLVSPITEFLTLILSLFFIGRESKYLSRKLVQS